MDWLALLVNALALGSAYALVALGFVLTINAIGAVNFAHGDLVMAGGFVAIMAGSQLGLSPPWALLLALAGTAALGLALSALAYFPLRRGPPVAVYVSTIAVGVALQNSAIGAFGAAPRRGVALFGGGQADLGIASLSTQALSTIATAALLGGALYMLLYRTALGRRLRAGAQDPDMAQAVGIDTNLGIAISFALAGALAGAAGALLAPTFLMTPLDGGNFILKAYIAAVLGGWGRLSGAAVASLLIALFETVIAAIWSQVGAEFMLYAAMLCLLWLRPQGLFGEALGSRS